MAIEFNCSNCGKLLRTGDDKAGARAKCPECGAPIEVPDADGDVDSRRFDRDEIEEEYEDEPYEEFAGAAASPETRPRGTQPCPMCGEQVPADATRCPYCGEELRPGAAPTVGVPQRLDAGDVISASWDIYKREMGLCIGGTVVVVILGLVAGLVLEGVERVMLAGAQGNLSLVLVVLLASMTAGLFVQSYLQLGLHILFLKVARGQRAEIGDVFTGGPYLLRMVGNSILFLIMLVLGLFACIVPGIIVALMFWPFVYVLVDRNPPGAGALSEAREITEGNWGAVVLLYLAMLGFIVLGLLACGVGVIFALPLTILMFAVAYAKMAGHRTAETV